MILMSFYYLWFRGLGCLVFLRFSVYEFLGFRILEGFVMIVSFYTMFDRI